MTIGANASVLELKQSAHAETQAQPAEIKVIFKGKILKDTDVLSECKVTQDATLHMVVVKAAAKEQEKPQTSEP